MSKWITLEKKGSTVLMDGEPMALSAQYSMGLGAIELRDTPRGGLHVVRFSGSGHFTYAIRLTKDGEYRLGATRGHRVIPPAEETDPIKRVLREMGVPISHLRLMTEGEPLEAATFCCDLWRAYREGTTTNGFVTDGATSAEVVSCRDMTSVNQFCGPEIHEAVEVTTATYAVEVKRRVHMNSSIGTYVGVVAVWPGCDPRALANALAPVIYGEGADADFAAALRDLAAAKKWAAAKFRITSHPARGDALLVEGRAFPLYSYVGGPYVLHQLAGAHGSEGLFPEYFGELQRDFLKALDSEEEAARYVHEHYRMLAVRCGSEQHIKVRLPEGGEWRDLNQSLPEGQAEPLKRLLETWLGLKSRLFKEADEKLELIPSHPQPSSIKLKAGTWVGRFFSEEKGWHEASLLKEEDAIRVRLGEGAFSEALVCLSSPERTIGVRSSMGGFHAVLVDGAMAYLDAYSAVLPIKVGETKHFVFRLSHAWSCPSSGASIWGITVRRDADGVTFSPYDNGLTYHCSGYWGSEVRSEVRT